MELDEGARQWLKEIEDMHLAVYDKQLELEKARKAALRNYKTEAATQRAASTFESLDAEFKALNEKLNAETARFYQNVLGITMYSQVGLKSSGNAEPENPFVVTQFSARLLSDQTAVFFASGDSLDKKLVNGLPVNLMVRAEESKGQRLVALN